ncbi:CLK4-associating serine/arginine rich protein [Parasteatoda tepidariorum]|uniref:CLK4-associating serine/arginine rich protein n=1 Tax=Parasteatoda tepidariorum TaxID=114398 RepID=UPI00077FC0E3|nr:CLK4-associating serine/arginine rich protein [Parasteatoda tepidariorum]
MWHEARKQEKKIRGMMVDYKRRAERRRDYYEKIKQDPAQFLQVHGRPAKIHLDPAVAIAADSPATMMPWQGHSDNLIDRFDVRAHLDIIPEYKPKNDDEPGEDRQACYERYRTLVQNDFLSVGEDKFLHQIYLEERFGIFKPGPEEEKKKLLDKKVAIGYVYEDSTGSPTRSSIMKDMEEDDEENEEDKEDDLSDLDLDVTIDVSVLTPAQSAEMNEHSTKYGMVDDDFITYLLQDKEEADQLRLAREIEEEKAMYSGRKSRRERRALREKKLAGRKITSPPSYAARESPTYAPMRHSTSKSRSRSPPEAGKIMFITSFGGEVSDGEQKSGNKNHASNSKSGKTKSKESGGSVIGPQLPSKNNDKKQSKSSKSSPRSDSSRSSCHSKRKETKSNKRTHGRSRHRSPSSSSRSRSRSPRKSSSRDKKRKYRRHSSSSRSRSRTCSSRSRSRSRLQSRRTKTRSRSTSRSRTDDKSRSPLLPPPPIKSYYRHSLSRSNSDVSDDESDGDKSPIRTSQLPNITGSSKLQPLLGKAGLPTKGTKLTPQERLKKKMQIALRKQYKADKKAQMEKSEKQMQERQDRAEELREMAIKLRQRERERRHKMRGYGYDSDSDTTWTKNPDYDPRNPDSHHSKKSGTASSRSSSYSSDETSPTQSFTSNSRRRSRTKSPPPRSSRRSPVEDRRRSSPPPSSYRKRSPSHRSPSRRSRSPLLKSPTRNSVKSPRRSPQHSRRSRSPDRSYRNSRSRQSPSRRYSPPRNSRRRSPSRSPSRQHSSSRQYRRGNNSPRRSRSPSRTYGSRPLVDY